MSVMCFLLRLIRKKAGVLFSVNIIEIKDSVWTIRILRIHGYDGYSYRFALFDLECEVIFQPAIFAAVYFAVLRHHVFKRIGTVELMTNQMPSVICFFLIALADDIKRVLHVSVCLSMNIKRQFAAG